MRASAARERMQAERAKQESAARKKRQVSVILAALVVIVAAVVIGIVVQNGRSSSYSATDAPGGTVGSTRLLIPVGGTGAPSTATIYEDPRCPACDQFEAGMKTMINQLLAQGKVQIQYLIASFIDRHEGARARRTRPTRSPARRTSGCSTTTTTCSMPTSWTRPTTPGPASRF
jgi:protein-disulfide isomerase